MSRYIWDKTNHTKIMVAGQITADGALSPSSTNAIQNKVVNTAVQSLTSDISSLTSTVATKANSADVPLKTQITNPNLLDNGWFTVNQRGLSTAGATNTYFVDRWKTIRDDGSLTWNGNGITLVNDLTQNSILAQSLESGLDTSKQYTMSVLFSDGAIVSGIFNATSSPVLLGSKSGQVDIYTSYVSAYNTIDIWFNNLSQSLTIRAIKLEKGSFSTLAMDSVPNYGEELLKCSMSTADSSDTYANRNTVSEKKLEQTATLSTSTDTTYTFSNAAIRTDSAVDVYTDIYGINPSSVSISAGSCTVTFPAQSTAQSMTCRIYVK